MKYNLVSNGDYSNITVFCEGEMYVADTAHPNFKKIVLAAVASDDSVVDMFDQEKAVAQKFEKLSERVSIAGGKVFFDGDEVNDALTNQIVRFMEEGVENWKPLVNFFENVASNPNEHSRIQLFEWLNRHKFTITSEGNILGYKAVHTDTTDGETVVYKSSSSGTALVNGVAQSGQIKQSLGDMVEMPRSNVQHDPAQGCHTGLHFGTWSYARSFLGESGTVVAVVVNPRDIVSVPTDCDAQKVRTCRYVLSEVVDGPTVSAWAGRSPSAAEEDVCSDCGSDNLCCSDQYCDDCWPDQHRGCEDCGNEVDDGEFLCESCDQ